MIPEEFTVGYKTYKVEKVTILTNNGQQVFGLFEPMINTISLATQVDGVKVSDNDMLAAFYHELIHAILYNMGELELNEDERFTEGFSVYLTQFNLTKK
jgi:ATP adenylyltransferase/5',5'''-P-1,P-4-tetraphosphate phosphorylase II